ncbi:unnamed protein product [Trichobilharzia szidati]|nr:unnamed protein product [Trichobilharzia szidati]
MHMPSTVPAAPEEQLCTSSEDTTQSTTLIDMGLSQITSLCKIEYTQFGEFYTCKVCNVKCTGKMPFLQHVMGSSHKRKFILNAPFCQEWNTNSNSSEQYASHCSGTSSESQTSGQTRMEQRSTGNNDTTYFCELCGLNCSSKKQLDCHLAGKRHLKQSRKRGAHLSGHLSVNSTLSLQSNQFNELEECLSQIFTSMNHTVENSVEFCQKVAHWLRNVIDLESKVESTNNISPLFLSPTSSPTLSCQKETDAVLGASPSERSNGGSLESRPFCKHADCVLLRSLQFYAKRLYEEAGVHE